MRLWTDSQLAQIVHQRGIPTDRPISAAHFDGIVAATGSIKLAQAIDAYIHEVIRENPLPPLPEGPGR